MWISSSHLKLPHVLALYTHLSQNTKHVTESYVAFSKQILGPARSQLVGGGNTARTVGSLACERARNILEKTPLPNVLTNTLQRNGNGLATEWRFRLCGLPSSAFFAKTSIYSYSPSSSVGLFSMLRSPHLRSKPRMVTVGGTDEPNLQ